MFMIFNAHVLEQTAVLLVSSQAVLFVNRVTITSSFYTSIAGQKEGEKRGRRERVRERERAGVFYCILIFLEPSLSLTYLCVRAGFRNKEYNKVEDAYDTRIPVHNEAAFQYGLKFKAKVTGHQPSLSS